MDNCRCTLELSFAGAVTVVGVRQPEAFNEEGVVGEYFWVAAGKGGHSGCHQMA